jgi:hypothetical protein
VTSEDPAHLLPGPYTPQQVLDALGPFADELRAHGFHGEACIFQGTNNGVLPDGRAEFWSAAADILATRPWMSLSLSKEWWKQTVDLGRLRKPVGQTWDGGGIADGLAVGLQISPGIWVTPLRGGTHDTFQAGRNDQWPRKTKSAWEIAQVTHVGCVTCEPMGADETDQPGRRSNVPDDFFWSAANARLTSLGSYFHSTSGAVGQVFGPATRACARAHFAALAAIPCESQLGRYAKAVPGGMATANYDDQPGGSLRTYGSLVSDADQWVVVTRPGPSYPIDEAGVINPTLINGWRILERHGPMGSVLRCVR